MFFFSTYWGRADLLETYCLWVSAFCWKLKKWTIDKILCKKTMHLHCVEMSRCDEQRSSLQVFLWLTNDNTDKRETRADQVDTTVRWKTNVKKVNNNQQTSGTQHIVYHGILRLSFYKENTTIQVFFLSLFWERKGVRWRRERERKREKCDRKRERERERERSDFEIWPPEGSQKRCGTWNSGAQSMTRDESC